MDTGAPPALRLLERYRRAMLELDADALADLYAPDAVHELPFLFPGMPARYEGREQVRAAYRAAWAASDARPEEIVSHAVHTTTDGTLVVEQTVVGTMASTGERFAFPGVLVLSVADGLLTRVRDYMDGLAVAAAAGRLDTGRR